nr:hypothetical protein Iba_scaffold12587CG0020 [Ipomoea batatas]GME19495.1 hypothetical protein Iba_scaffold23039CG0010 [Ipomoea batatas]
MALSLSPTSVPRQREREAWRPPARGLSYGSNRWRTPARCEQGALLDGKHGGRRRRSSPLPLGSSGARRRLSSYRLLLPSSMNANGGLQQPHFFFRQFEHRSCAIPVSRLGLSSRSWLHTAKELRPWFAAMAVGVGDRSGVGRRRGRRKLLDDALSLLLDQQSMKSLGGLPLFSAVQEGGGDGV